MTMLTNVELIAAVSKPPTSADAGARGGRAVRVPCRMSTSEFQDRRARCRDGGAGADLVDVPLLAANAVLRLALLTLLPLGRNASCLSNVELRAGRGYFAVRAATSGQGDDAEPRVIPLSPHRPVTTRSAAAPRRPARTRRAT